MFVLKLKKGKTYTIIGTAESQEEAASKQNTAALNGFVVEIEPISSNELVFKERDYDDEFMQLINTIRDAHEALRKIPTHKLTLSQTATQEAVNVLTSEHDDLVVELAKKYQLYVSMGDYGYGREIVWRTSNGVTTGYWQSSSETC